MTLNGHSLGRFVDSQEMEALLQQKNAIKILDVRTPAEYETVHIPGSYNIPLDQLPKHRTELGNKLQTPIILVCRSGARAEQAARQFEETNLTQFHILRGGINAWEQAGKPVKRGKLRWSMERQVRGAAGILVLLGTVGGLFVWKPLSYLATGIGAGLTYSALTDTCGMALLLSKLPYNRTAQCDVRDVVRQFTALETGTD
ncbi:sulfurtransferase [Reticulibacter mediterranei]|uniref:Sulfurtransferase n=1 Tax=Reticulibacter mediterranei TaxID=2778369 RepID=A0A8J3MZI1_9CHLR|nr:rhodanese-like domain-containing protein [Reticulibacter mediterranei]GHO93129.1 sulfurtransferase [Reticulibacter mediterranei]